MLFSIMPGIKFYEFPTAMINGQQVQVSLDERSVFNTTILTTLEYYFDPKTAITISFFQNQVWDKKDFWEDGGSAFGFSIGIITALI
jgi:hypothetical protein